MSSYYYGHSKDEAVNRSCSSGGAAYCISKYAIENDMIVFGVKYSDDFKRAIYTKVDNIDNLDQLKGSKYIFPDYHGVVNSILLSVSENKKVVVFGLPCFINSLAKQIENRDNVLLIDLICHGPTFCSVQEEFINYLEKRYKSRVTFFTSRFKKKNKTDAYVLARFQNGKTYCKKLYYTYFGKAFEILSGEGCFSCLSKGDNRDSDITLGDYWGCDESFDGFSKYGNSILVAHTQKGIDLIKSLDNMFVFNTDDSLLKKHNPMYYKSAVKQSRYDKFKTDFNSRGIVYACKKNMSFKEKISFICPDFIRTLIRKF